MAFVCKDCCKEENQFKFDGPSSMGISVGPCEDCKKTKECIDEH